MTPGARRGLAAEEDVLGGGEVRHQRQLLVDGADAEVVGLPRALDAHHAAVDLDRPRIPRHRAAQDLHQRRLARAVLAEQYVNFSLPNVEIDAVERDDAGERFADAGHPQREGGIAHGHVSAQYASGDPVETIRVGRKPA